MLGSRVFATAVRSAMNPAMASATTPHIARATAANTWLSSSFQSMEQSFNVLAIEDAFNATDSMECGARPSRRPRKANRGKRPCSHHRRRLKRLRRRP